MTAHDRIEFERRARRAMRICLACDAPFYSASKGNRICQRCGQLNAASPPVAPRGRVRHGHAGGQGEDS